MGNEKREDDSGPFPVVVQTLPLHPRPSFSSGAWEYRLGAMEALVSGTSVEGTILVWPLRRESVWRTDKEPKLRAGNRASGTERGPERSGHLCVTRALRGGVDAGGLRETGRD